MVKKLFITLLFISQVFSFPPPPVTFEVINTNDSGEGSLRQAVVDFIANQHRKIFGVGIWFTVPNVDAIVITLESDIIIEDAEGWIGSITYGNKKVTITGTGRLIVNSSNVRIAENIKYIFQPKSLLALAAYALVNVPSYPNCRINFLPAELKELIYAVNQPKKSLPVVPKKIHQEISEPCIIS